MTRQSGTLIGVRHGRLVAAIVLWGAAVCAAQTASTPQDVTADRPDFTESTDVVGHQTIQIELGLAVEHTDGTQSQITVPQVLVRIGLGSRFELRFGGDGFVSQSIDTPAGRARVSGASDASLGVKLKFLDEEHAGIDMAVIPLFSLPTASEGLGSMGHDPGLKLAASRELPAGFGLSGNFNVLGVTEAAGRRWEREASISLAHAIGGPVNGYWEVYGPLSNGRCACALDTGLTMALNPTTLIDLEVGRALSGAAADWFVGVGLVIGRLGW